MNQLVTPVKRQAREIDAQNANHCLSAPNGSDGPPRGIANEATKQPALKYRRDIDGLRCVAVLSVLLFHLSPSRLRGGFVGVDVFFVISGYLISAIVFSEIANSQFSVVGFYERRIRRIFPALFAMLIAVSAAMSFLLLPVEFVDYAKSVFAAAISSSNFYFWQHSGYFDDPTSNPMLHTWSLAVEEQFYILFPIFLVLIRRIAPRYLKHGVMFLFVASLTASAVEVHLSPTADFYMPYTRAWELLLGTLISLGFFPRLTTGWLRNFITALGIAMIAYAAIKYSPDTPFPGLAALVPCVGSVLIIGAGESGSTFVGNVLSWRPVVFIGLISYSLYLWHWPLIVLNDLGFSFDLSFLVPNKWAFLLLTQAASKMTILVLSFVLAVLSWRFVERPFRSRPKRIERGTLFAWSAAVMTILLLASTTVIYAHGFPSRFSQRAAQVAALRTPPGASTLGQLGSCAITESNSKTVFDDPNCIAGRKGADIYLLIGDSHAGSLHKSLAALLPNADIDLMAVWGCRPSIHAEGSALCKQMMDFIFQRYLPSHPVRGLLLEARWYSNSLDGLDDIAVWCKSHAIRAVIFGPVAEYDAPLPTLLAYAISRNKPDLAQQHLLPYSPVMDTKMQDLAANKWHTCYVSLYRATCKDGQCLEYADGAKRIPILSDADHLTEDGSMLLIHRLSQQGQLDCLHDKGIQRAQNAQ